MLDKISAFEALMWGILGTWIFDIVREEITKPMVTRLLTMISTKSYLAQHAIKMLCHMVALFLSIIIVLMVLVFK